MRNQGIFWLILGVMSVSLGYGCNDSPNSSDAQWVEKCPCAEVLSLCEADDPSYCKTDDDCVCDFEKQFKGNKTYAEMCVKKANAINPNFCSADEEEMAEPGEGMICMNNACTWGQKYECIDKDGDGYYANKECWNKGLSDCDDNNPDVNADNGC